MRQERVKSEEEQDKGACKEAIFKLCATTELLSLSLTTAPLFSLLSRPLLFDHYIPRRGSQTLLL